jgi:hypothetical protein
MLLLVTALLYNGAMSDAENRRNLGKTDRWIARAEQRVEEETSLLAQAERGGRDTSTIRRLLAALKEWMRLLIERRAILLQRWRRSR